VREPRAHVRARARRGEERSPGTGAELFRRAADANDPDGQFHYGRILERGIGGRRDVAEALKLYRLAANKENARAQFNLARLLETGTDEMEPDKEDAVRCYTRAAHKGHVMAREALARIERERSL
jgi:TPR repeat protein